jgi:hypothetical protein
MMAFAFFSPAAALSVDYYKGWADGLAQTAQAAGVKLLPAVCILAYLQPQRSPGRRRRLGGVRT